MSEESSDSAREAETPGAVLKQERERQGLAQQRIADDLHLSTQMIEAIESNQFSRLGAPVFARGHLRKYAQLLSVPVERIHELYQALNDRPSVVDPVPVMHRASEPSIPMSPDSLQRRAAQHPKLRLIILAIALVAVAVAAAWWWWQTRETTVTTGATVTSATAPDVVSVAEQLAVTNNASTTSSVLPVAQTVVANDRNVNTPMHMVSSNSVSRPATKEKQETSSQSLASNSKVRLRFAFTQESWVEVYDGRGVRILYDVGQPSQSRSLSVDPPAKVTLGMAAGVSTDVNGRAIVVPARNINNAVAHFTIAADGSIE